MRSTDARIITALLLTVSGLLPAARTQSVASAQSVPPPQTQPAATAPGSVVVLATVDAFWSADQYAKTAGYISEVKHDIGDRVKKGDLLAVLYVPELEKNLVQAKATLAARQQMKKAADAAVAQTQQALAVTRSQLEGYQADLYLAQVTLKRQEELSAGKAATAQQLDDARAKGKIAQANVAMGEARVNSAQADIQAAEANRDVAAAQVDVADAQVQEVEALLEYTRITAPFDGVVTRRQVNPGDLVQAATANRTIPLFAVQSFDTVRVFCDVPESQAIGVSIGADAEVKLYALAGQVIKGKVTRLANAIDPSSRTMRTEIDLPNPSGVLRPGMYAQVTIKLQQPPPVADAAAGAAQH
ncbi:MAG TPA: efflux RND transporter periplasmic adaptor subunit [Tepidisphaeraceae bacterium]|jgi:multidrug resistance efflux pump|nr:efflux RND transporter periplasmic adaptor subunit [Tepidisphaeraceae bacterium]